MDDTLELTWTGPVPADEDFSRFECRKILIPDFGHFLVFFADRYSVSSEGMTLTLPETAYTLVNRKISREPAAGVTAAVLQNGTLFEGTLRDFSPEGFLLRLEKQAGANFKWLNPEEPLSVMFRKEGSLLYSGECRISSFRGDSRNRECVVLPVFDSIRRFGAKKYRGERYELTSPLHITFDHPFSGRPKQLRIRDISGSGFSVLESEKQAALFAGLILPEARLMLPGNTVLTCRAQVIYRCSESEERPDEIKCGLAILDMEPREHSCLLNFIHQEIDDRAYVCNKVDMTALWSFFFESGFIYPEKYRHILANKEKIKSLYEKLYTRHPGIARHFIYQEGSHIQGHMSMLRSYENTWLLHHHAASTVHSQHAGLHVLNQVGSFGNNCHRIESLHLNYLICYFRRENKFPNRMFGGLADKIGDPKSCSLDDWAYFHFNRREDLPSLEGTGWSVRKTTPGELKDLECFYETRSGGLMLRAFNLEGDDTEETSLFREYDASGFSREIDLFSLHKEGRTCGIIMVDRSEAGLNMSDLTNSFKVFLTEPAGLTRDILDSVLQSLSHRFPEDKKIPVLMYPHDQAAVMDIPPEKIYTLWVINMEASDRYFHYLKLMLRIIRH